MTSARADHVTNGDRRDLTAMRPSAKLLLFGAALALSCLLGSCGNNKAEAKNPAGEAAADVSVGVIQVGRKDLQRTLTVSSELVPFQEIDVYAKESGFVKELLVDYGSRVKANQTIAVLEIPELQSQLKQDDAAINNAKDQITHAQNELSRAEAQHKVFQLQFDRLNGVFKSKPGLVAQQEVDDAEGKSLTSDAQVEAARSNLGSAESQLASTQAKREHDQVLFDYSNITAPFAGVVTQRFANKGTLVQAGTSSSTNVIPIVRLSEDDLFRLVIPVPETYVRFIHIGDPVQVRVPSLSQNVTGKISRFSVDVKEDTRTMHTEVDVPNPNRALLPGLYADATIALEKKTDAVYAPVQAVDRNGERATVDVVTTDHTIEIRPVVLGIQTATDVEIISGLKEGESIAVSDRSSLKAGQHVQPKTIELLQYQNQEGQR
jgi:RND family efflux transporter MFP subunit